jgi:arsenate reductase
MNKTAATKLTTDKLPKGKGKEKITIYHNTRCTKSREACSILEKKGVDFTTIEYLKEPLNQTELKALLKKLNLKAEEIVRKSEPLFKEKFASKKLTEAQWIKILTENPILIERPILVKGNKAIIGRPVERVVEILK